MRYETRTGLAGFFADCGIDTLEAVRESPDPSPAGTAGFADFVLDALLSEELLPLFPRKALVSILGALSSVSQLHWPSHPISNILLFFPYSQRILAVGLVPTSTYPEELA